MDEGQSKTALLDKATELRAGSFRSEASTSRSNRSSADLDSALHSGSIPQAITIPVSVDHLEQLLKACAEALAKTRNEKTPAPLPVSAATNNLSLAHQSPYDQDEKLAIQAKAEHKEVPPLDHYDIIGTETADLEDEEAWNEEKQRREHLLNSIGDIWQNHFPNCSHRNFTDPGHTTCHPLSDPGLRLECQRDLVLARLNLEQDGDKLRSADHFLPWLSVIAYKLDQIHELTHSFSRLFFRRYLTVHGIKLQRCNLLVQVLRYFYEGPWHYLARNHEFTVGSLLGFCYKRGALQRPDCPSDPRLESNFRHVVHALWILNIVQTPRYWLTYTFNASLVEQRLPVIGSYVLAVLPLDAISRSVEAIESALQERQPELPSAAGENVLCGDLNLAALRNIGGLKIVWTACDRDHMFLDQENGVLRLSFFNRVLVPEFYRYMATLGQNDIARTWTLLLGYRKHKDDTSELESILLPPELAAYNAHVTRQRSRIPVPRRLRYAGSSGLLAPKLNSTRLPDIRDKLNLKVQPLPRSVPYDYFGRYEYRIRILRHYMDTRKPTGIRNLWHDRRDSLSYYTFWAVVVFGGTSMLLAAMGVALGVAQTIAAFKQLEGNG
ncbi:MAG: hypothetical protein MMC23_002416 [Stictis urceolatum]|nr:hypothetical protein [Stictis urceolata]